MSDSFIEADFTKLYSLVEKLDTNIYTDVGILGDARYENGATIAGVGAIHEFGSLDKHLPERSFIRMPIETKQDEIQKDVELNFEDNLEKGNVEAIFKDIGVACEGVIQDAFNTGGFGTWEDIKQETKDKKESDSILIDKSDLMKSITSEVGKA